MLTVERRPDGVLLIAADGLLTTEDYAEFVPRFEQLAHLSNPVLIELGPNFTGWSLGGLWRDLKFDATHLRQFGRMAVLGDKQWEKWGTQASDLLFPGEMRFFERENRRAAEEWLHEPGTRT